MILNAPEPHCWAWRLLRPLLLVLLVAIVGLAMAGCGSTAQLVQIRVPVPVECRVARPARPAMPTEALQPADPLDTKVKAALAEIEIREGFELELQAALDTCTAPIKDPPPP